MARAQRKTEIDALVAAPESAPKSFPGPAGKRAKLSEADAMAHTATASPVHDHLDALASAFGPTPVAAPQLRERKYPGYVRAAIILGGSVALWASIIAAGGRILSLAH